MRHSLNASSLRQAAFALALMMTPIAIHAQTATIVGYPANFDAINDTGGETHGFEIEADGITSQDVYRIFGGSAPCYIRYCTGQMFDFPGGVYIRWTSPYDATTGQFTLTTPIPNGTLASGESCWTLGLGSRYPAAGCEHFGISSARNPTRVVYRWLVADLTNPGQLAYFGGVPLSPGNMPPPPTPTPVVMIPQPVINIFPPAQPGGLPAVDFEIQVPPPPPPPPFVAPQFGTAQWVKVFKNEVANEVDLNDLMAGNPVVPLDPAQVESPFSLLQKNPHSANSGTLHNQAVMGNGNHAVVRRYEFYKYTGTIDPLTNEALCSVARCASPGPGELGDLIGAQNAAANIEIPSITVVKVGSGTVGGTNKINCGGSCTAQVPAGTTVSLTANPPGNGIFSGWSGACTGTDPACSVVVNTALTATATFTQVFTLSIARGGSGSISGTPNGAFNTFIGCGSSCSAKFPVGTVVTLTATPVANAKFVSWTGACSGILVPTCTLTIAKDTQAGATFK